MIRSSSINHLFYFHECFSPDVALRYEQSDPKLWSEELSNSRYTHLPRDKRSVIIEVSSVYSDVFTPDHS